MKLKGWCYGAQNNLTIVQFYNSFKKTATKYLVIKNKD